LSTPDPVTIRPERASDIEAIRAVNVAAFGRPGHPADEAGMVDALRANGKAVLSLVAEVDGVVVGHVMFSPVTFETASPALPAVGLGPVGVRPERQGRGIGSALVRAGLDECRRLGYGSVFLVGWPAYYNRFGFQPAHLYGLRPPQEPRLRDAFQVIELQAGALAGASGVVREAEELS
jgi:putative acetyltransferase